MPQFVPLKTNTAGQGVFVPLRGQPGKKSKKKGRGFASRFGHDLVDAAVASPGGLYAVGKAAVADTRDTIEGKYVQDPNRKSALDPILKGTAESFQESVQHPLRHPGNTFLNALAVASVGAGTAARVGAAGKALGGAGDAGRLSSVAKALAKAPPPKARVIRHGGHEVVSGSYSKSASTRAAQRLLDKAREAFPETPIVGRSQVSRFGRATAQQRKIEEGLARAPAADLRVRGKKLSAGEQQAIRIQAEGVPVADRIAFEQKKLQRPNLKPAVARKVKKNILELQAAKPYLDEAGTTIVHPKLSKIYDDAKALADERTALLQKSGVLTAEASARRVSAPAEIINAATGKGDFRVPYVTKAPKRSADAIAGSGAGNMVGVAKKPGSLTHSFEGKILEGTGGRNDVTTLVAESNIEAQRFTHLVAARDRIAQLAHDDPNAVPEKYRVAVNLGELKGNRVPQSVRDILDKAVSDARLSKDEVNTLGVAYDSIRDEIFPKHIPEEPTAGFKWIDSRMLGDLHKQNPLIGFNAHGSVRAGLNVFDQINSAQKFAILYLKPAYAIPNLLGNAALTLIQQGVFAPANLTRAARLNARLGYKAARGVDEVMGEGIFGVLHDQGFLRRINNLSARGYGAVVDRPFRRSAFLHEARRQGYKTGPEINKLLFDEGLRSDLIQVVQRANSELIDYTRLGPVEKSMIARVIFFYPWVKGSTIYAARLLGEHPVTAAAMAELGRIGREQQQQALGNLPSYLDGLIRTGGSDMSPRVVNPAAAAIVQTPSDLAQSLLGVAGIGKAGAPTSNLSPAAAALITLLTGQNSLGYDPSGESNAKTAGKSLYEGLPAFQLQKRLRGIQTSKSATYSERDALLKFLLGISPYTVDRAKLNEQASR